MGTSCFCWSRRCNDCLNSVVPFCSDEIGSPCQNLLYCICCFIMYVAVSCRIKCRDCHTLGCCTAVEEGDNTEHESAVTSSGSTIRGTTNNEINGTQPMAESGTPSPFTHPDDRTPPPLRLIRVSQLPTSTHST